MLENNNQRVLVKILALITILIIIYIALELKNELTENKIILIKLIKKTGIIAPIIFIIIQIIQTIIPIIPSGITCIVGVLTFGPILGFIYNYIGLTIGSITAFYLTQKYGYKILKKIFEEETLNKYFKYIKENKFEKIFIIGILFPCFPDDLLCYVAGISKINIKKFLLIIILCKPLTLLTYSIFLSLI